tara:strand:+ start:258 stop:452 length:195 start_codon:yes stop_codon:yes gene_type:complete
LSTISPAQAQRGGGCALRPKGPALGIVTRRAETLRSWGLVMSAAKNRARPNAQKEVDLTEDLSY